MEPWEIFVPLLALIGLKSLIFGNRWPWQPKCPTCGNRLCEWEKKR